MIIMLTMRHFGALLLLFTSSDLFKEFESCPYKRGNGHVPRNKVNIFLLNPPAQLIWINLTRGPT